MRSPQRRHVRAVLLGPPGSGKSTQAARVARRYGVSHLSTGALLRSAAERPGPGGEHIRQRMAHGELVEDETVVGMLAERLAEAPEGWVLDGFPRTVGQAAALDALADRVGAVNAAVYLDVAERTVLERIRGRAPNLDRADDATRAVRRRMRVFAEHADALLDHYDRRGLLVRVDAGRGLDEVTREIVAAVEARRAGC